MAFEEVLGTMQESIRASLDEISSPRSSPSTKTKALRNLERHLASACVATTHDDGKKDAFLALQFTFECNIPSHLLPWITLSTLRLEGLTSKSLSEDERASEMDELVSLLGLSLCLIQGVVLNHNPSKIYLGRRCSLEILLDLLLASRHLPSQPDTAAESIPKSAPPAAAASPHVTSTVLDTLLCILVDSTDALRAFEEASGVQAIVKILKRAGTPREVRMKCLEFLYFYLLDETPSASSSLPEDADAAPILSLLKSTQPTPPPTAPATPIRPSKPYFSGTPLRHPTTSRYGSSTFSFSSTMSSLSGGLTLSDSGNSSSDSSSGSMSKSTVAGGKSSNLGGKAGMGAAGGAVQPMTPAVKSLRSASGSSTASFSSTSSNASSSTAASSVNGSSPIKESHTHSTVLPLPLPSTNTNRSFPVQKSPVKGQSRLMTPRNRDATPPTSPGLPSASANRFPQSQGQGQGQGEAAQAQPRSLMMLRKEVDYVPMSPKKVLVVGVGKPPGAAGAGAGAAAGAPASASAGGGATDSAPPVTAMRRGHRKSLSASTASASPLAVGGMQRKRSEGERERYGYGMGTPLKSAGRFGVGREGGSVESVNDSEGGAGNGDVGGGGSGRARWRTTEEKKELLGTMLGNVDALVEGVRKAGIWGLG